MSTLFFLILLVTACSKDADLLSDYVIAKDGDLESIALLVDDQFFIGNGQSSIIMDVLNNDNFNSDVQINIVETSTPQNGEVIINEDNTLTYTPQNVATTPEETPSVEESSTTAEFTETPVEDTFTYTTEVTTPDNEVSRQEATVTVSQSDMGELLAFPGAEGFGKYTTGGRGGTVIHVTNLNDSGPGSLRAALEKTGIRTVVFDVGGDIFLTSGQLGIYSGHGNLTIAGETAPYPGITIRGDRLNSSNSYGGTLDISASNIIIRYISVRGNQGVNTTNNDAIRLQNSTTGMNNIILDHVSLSNADDGNIDMRGVTNFTIQNSMLTDSDRNINSLFGRDNFNTTWIGNYLSHSPYRNILLGYGTNRENIEFINNITYGYEEGMFITFGHHADIIGNVYKAFPGNTPDYPTIVWKTNGTNNTLDGPGDGGIYLSDNFQLNTHKYGLFNEDAATYKKSTRQINNSSIYTWAKTVSAIENRVFGGKLPGNSLHQDNMDEAAIMDYFNNSGNFGSLSVTSKQNTSRSSSYDSDNDGMADEWERSIFGNLSKSANGDEDNNGYTNLETFLYYLTK